MKSFITLGPDLIHNFLQSLSAKDKSHHKLGWCDSLHPSQQFFSHVRIGLLGLNQY